jgi:hypothetical protein
VLFVRLGGHSRLSYVVQSLFAFLMYVEFFRSWWCCGEAPRGFQLAMLFLTWALLLLLLCMPPMANAEIGKVQADTERLSSLGDGQEILEVTLKGKVLCS